MTKTFKDRALRIPPQNLDAEKALLGSILLKSDAMHDIVDFIFADSFYAERHRKIFRGMMDLYAKNQPVDILSVSSRLQERGELDQIGGNVYLSDLSEGVPSSANARHYADIVYKKSVLRNIINAADHISELGYSENLELEQLVDDAEKELFAATNIGTSQRFIQIKTTLDEAWERLERLQESGGKEMRGISTGFPSLDAKLAGLQRSDLIILAARPSVGKTSFALDIARHSAIKHGTKVGLFSLEMSSQQLVDRMLSAQARVDSWKLRTGRLSTDEEFAALQRSMAELSSAPIFIDDNSGNNVLMMRSVARKLKKEHGLDLIVIDYLQLIHPTKNYDSMVNQVTEISRALKGLARELDIPVVALSQLSRAVEQRGGKPRLSDLRDSGSIEQDADVVMFIHREDKNNENSDRQNIAEILIEKHRNGPTGKIELFFNDKLSSFEELERGEFSSGVTVAKADAFDNF